MLKKALIGSGVALALGAFVFGTDLFSYARTSASSVRHAVKSEVPLDFEIKRAREMVENLVPDIRNCMHLIAEQQVDLEHLKLQVARTEESLGQQKTVILALRNDLESGKDTFVYANHKYDSDDLRRDLASRFERFKSAEASLEKDRRILAARVKALAANEDKLDTMLAAKQELEVQIEQLQARLKTLQAAEAATAIEFDDSQLSKARTLIRELNKQLDVREKVLDAAGKFADLIPVEEEVQSAEDITRDIDVYFQQERQDAVETDEESTTNVDTASL